MVLPDSHRVSRALCYSGFALTRVRFRLRVFHPLWTVLPDHSSILFWLNARPTTPKVSRPLVWAVPLSLAATDGITDLFSFPLGTKMVQFPRFACTVLCIQTAIPIARRVTPFGHPRIKACEAAPRGFSQPTTSFVASRCLGIHRLPLTCFVPARLTCVSALRAI
jgi:hypothetical protein